MGKTYDASDGPSFSSSSTPPAPRQYESQSTPVIDASSNPKKVENEYHRARNQEPAAVSLGGGGGGSLPSILTDQTKLVVAVGGVTALAAAGVVYFYSPRQGARVIRSCVERIFLGQRPSLVRESSRGRPYPWSSGILSTRYTRSLARSSSSHNDQEGFGDVILNPSLQERMQQLAAAAATSNAESHQAVAPPFRRNLLFYGPPSTGKKMAARELADRCGLDYALVSGHDVAPLGPQEAVTKIHELFDWSSKSRKGLLLFIDEADEFLCERRRKRNKACMSEAHMSALMNALLSRTGDRSNSKDTVLVLATTGPGDLDSAVAARIDESLEFPLPGVEERFRLLKLYVDKYIAQAGARKPGWWFNNLFNKEERKIEIKGLTDHVIREAADETEGFSGHDIAVLMDIAEEFVHLIEPGVLDPKAFRMGVHANRLCTQPHNCWGCGRSV